MKTRQTISIFFIAGFLLLMTCGLAHSYDSVRVNLDDGGCGVMEWLDNGEVWLYMYDKDYNL